MNYKLDDILNFGKYKGRTIKEIIQEDINYIVWCLIQIDDFQLSDDSAIEFINNKEKILLNHSRLKDHKAMSILIGFEEGDFATERNKNIAEIINKIGRKK
ncbi:hypothetical protein LNI90_11605 [Tenacibaculum dicentrarchi]|nr:hypothetical protein [Tenacibaculum dicentrarchi]MCD8452728.1 hypothetical protein [Tenacibaculum dicentrarchi]MCG8829060.1 hypothetical protein [Tenacibaculum dicentrarchi]